MEIPSHSLSMTVLGNVPEVGYTVAQMNNNWTTKTTATTTMQSLQSTYADQSDMGGDLLDDRNCSTVLDLSEQFPKANTQVSKITVSFS